MPLPGGRTDLPWGEFAASFARTSGLPRQTVEHLLRVYGARAPEVLATASTPELREVFDPFTGAIAAEVPWAYHEEGARTLIDVIARRTMVGLGPDAGIGADVGRGPGRARHAWLGQPRKSTPKSMRTGAG